MEENRTTSKNMNNLPVNWSIKRFDEFSSFFSGGTPSTSNKNYYEGDIPFIKSGEIESAETEQYISFVALKDSSAKIVEKGDILFALYGANSGEVAISKIEGAINQAILCIRPKADKYFIKYFLELNKDRLVAKYLQGGQGNLSAKIVKHLKIPFPPIKEQNVISTIIHDWEIAIDNLEESILQLKKRKKGLMQQIFSGELRLQNPSGKSFPDWKAQKLGYYLKVSKAKNLDLKYGDEDVLSVSGEFGIVNQIEFHGRSFAGASVANYGVVETGDIVYTKSPLKANPYGIIKVNKGVPGIVSTLYAIYKCKPTVNGEFVDYYFQLDDNVNRYLRPLVQKGTKNDMKINNEKVLIDKVLFPSVEEQAVIVDFFKTVDQEITETKNYLETLKTQKKGLMQKLLTGEVRVKI